MRIGNLDGSNRSEDLIQLLRPENQQTLTGSRKMKNWWHYHKWYVIAGMFLFAAACSLFGNALGIFTKSPDLQIAYIGKTVLPQDTVRAMEQIFASLAGDYNQDGEILVRVHQYISDSQTADAETAYYQYASEITLLGDIAEAESYFFLMDNPQSFQQEHQLLASSDGNCPGQADYSVRDKTILWSDCPILSEAEAGSYTETAAGQTVTGSNQEILAGLYLGRRCFYNEKRTEHADECSALWDLLYSCQANVQE